LFYADKISSIANTQQIQLQQNALAVTLIILDTLLIRSFIGSRPSDHYFRSVCWL